MDRILNGTRTTHAVPHATTAALQSYMDWLLLAAWATACIAGLWQQELLALCFACIAASQQLPQQRKRRSRQRHSDHLLAVLGGSGHALQGVAGELHFTS